MKMKTVDEICEEVGVDPYKILISIAKGDHKALGEKDPIPEKLQKKAAKTLDRLWPEWREES